MRKTSRPCRWMAALLAVLLLAVLLLAGCGGAGGASPAQSPTESGPGSPSGGPGSEPAWDYVDSVLCRIVDGAEEGNLLLASQSGEGDSLFRLAVGEDTYVTVDDKEASADRLQDGMLLQVVFGGDVMESYPAMFGGVIAVNAVTAGLDDRCGLALQVLDDLWTEDSGLNGDVEYFGLDIDEALIPQRAEREAIAWRFAELHGAEPLLGTWQELADEGYIDEENLYWEDGLHFSLTASKGKTQKENKLYFSAGKWRGGLGAIYFTDCTADRTKTGSWTYEPGGFAIA